MDAPLLVRAVFQCSATHVAWPCFVVPTNPLARLVSLGGGEEIGFAALTAPFCLPKHAYKLNQFILYFCARCKSLTYLLTQSILNTHM